MKYGECWDWAQRWQQTVSAQRPDVSLMVLGHWEVVNRNVDGKVMHVGQPVYDNLLKAQLEKAVSVLGSEGGKVALATAPCYLRPERADGTLLPAGRLPPGAGLQQADLGGRRGAPDERRGARPLPVLQPRRQVAPVIGGHQVRDPDGIHFNIDGGQGVVAGLPRWDLRELLGLPELSRRRRRP